MRQRRGNARTKFLVGVNPCAHRRASQREFAQTRHDSLQPFDAPVDLRRIAAELLAQADRHGVHQVGPTGLRHVVELGRLLAERLLQVLQRGEELFAHLHGRGDMNAGWNYIVRRLAQIDVVIGMHQ